MNMPTHIILYDSSKKHFSCKAILHLIHFLFVVEGHKTQRVLLSCEQIRCPVLSYLHAYTPTRFCIECRARSARKFSVTGE